LPAAARIVARALKLRRPLSPRRRHLDRAFMLWRYIARAFSAFLRASALHVPRRFRPDRKRGRADEYVYPLSSGARSAFDLLRLSRRSRGHQQRLGAKAAALRDPAKSYQRLPRHVGRQAELMCAPPSTPQDSRAQTPSRQSSTPWSDAAKTAP